MNYSDVIRFTSGLLQLGVACYALRLGRRFNSPRLGWLLFSALSLFALAYLLLPIIPFRSSVPLAAKVDVISALISMILIAGMIHLDLKVKKSLRGETAERQAQSEWESTVQEKVEQLNRTNEELQQAAAKLQSEAAEQKRAQEQTEKTYQEQLVASRQTEAGLREQTNALETQLTEHMHAKEQAEIAHQAQLTESLQTGNAAGKMEAAAGFLPGIGEALGRLNAACLTADDLGGSRLAAIGRIAKLLCECARDISHAAKRNLHGRQSGDRLVQVAQQLAVQQTLLRKRIDSIAKQLALAKEAVQQSYDQIAAVAGVNTITDVPAEEVPIEGTEAVEQPLRLAVNELTPVESVLTEPPNAGTLQEHFISNVTQTGTESAATEQPIAPEEAQDPAPESIAAPAPQRLSLLKS